MSATRTIRAGLVGLGVLLLAQGLWVGWMDIAGHDRIHVLLWFVSGVVVHDGLLAPVSVLLGRRALPHLPTSAHWAARALLAWVATVLVIGLPVVRQDRRPANPTIEFGHPFVGICVAIALGVVLAAVVQIVLTARGSAARGSADPP